MSDLLAKKANLEARYAELNQRLQAIQQDYARGLDADSRNALKNFKMLMFWPRLNVSLKRI